MVIISDVIIHYKKLNLVIVSTNNNNSSITAPNRSTNSNNNNDPLKNNMNKLTVNNRKFVVNNYCYYLVLFPRTLNCTGWLLWVYTLLHLELFQSFPSTNKCSILFFSYLYNGFYYINSSLSCFVLLQDSKGEKFHWYNQHQGFQWHYFTFFLWIFYSCLSLTYFFFSTICLAIDGK